MRRELAHAQLYGIIDLGYVEPRQLKEKTLALLAGGVEVLQLRAKNQPVEEIRRWAAEILPLCRREKVPFIVNDYPEVALEVGADGVHIGQDDGTLRAVRKRVGEKMLVGRSTHSLEQAQEALEEGFDYIGFGPLFPTPTKEGRPAIGLDDLALVEERVGCKIPVFSIGGIKVENLPDVIAAGARRVVIVSGLLCTVNSTAVARKVREILRRADGR